MGWINDAIDAFKRLNNWLNDSEKKRITAAGGTYYEKVDGSNANGLDYVPFDGYISELHRGEAVLTAQENRVWQQFKQSGTTAPRGVSSEELTAILRQVAGSQQGPKELTLNATFEVGGAAWARRQYRFDLEESERHGKSFVNK